MLLQQTINTKRTTIAAALAFIAFSKYSPIITPCKGFSSTFSRHGPRHSSQNNIDNKMTVTFYQNENMNSVTDSSLSAPQKQKEYKIDTSKTAGVLTIANEEELTSFLTSHPDKLLVLKFHASYCQACKQLGPKYKKLSRDYKTKDSYISSLPIVFAEIDSKANTALTQKLGIEALPSVVVFAGSDGVIYSGSCAPSKLPAFKKQLENIVEERFDDNGTLQLFNAVPDTSLMVDDVIEEINVQFTDDDTLFLREEIPFLKELTDSEFSDVLEKATLRTYPPGALLASQGSPCTSLLVIKSGTVDVHTHLQVTEDPLVVSPSALGTCVNVLGAKDYIGERALTTGENFAASISATTPTTCFAFREENFPERCFYGASRRVKRTRIAEADEKYGVDVGRLYQGGIGGKVWEGQVAMANVANQARGSTNHPEVMRGVDTDEELINDEEILRAIQDAGWVTRNTGKSILSPRTPNDIIDPCDYC